MRRRTLQRLAHLGRLACLLGALGAGATAWVWHYRPAWIDNLDAWLIRKSRGPFEQRLAEALAVTEPARAEALLEALAAELTAVKRQDHLAYVATTCYRRLSELREQAGDLPAAIDWMAESVAFDDHNLRALVRLHELRGRRPETAKQGDDDLAALWAQFPGSPWVAPAWVQRLATRGDGDQALTVLEQAIGAIESNLWTFVWDPGKSPDGKDLPEIGDLDRGVRRADIVPVIADGVLRLRFVVAEPVERLRYYLPPFASFGLLQPRLRMLGAGKYHEVDLATDPGESVHLRRGDGRIDAFGESGPFLTVQLPERMPAGSLFELTARHEDTESSLLLAPLRGPAYGQIEQALAASKADGRIARLRQLRGLALHQSAMQVFWRTKDGDFGSKNSKPTAMGVHVADGAPRFAVAVPLGDEITQLRLDLPEDVGVRYHLERLALSIDGKEVELDVTALPLLFSNDLERQGAELTVTGKDPYFGFAVPSGPARVAAITCEGSIR